MTSIDFYVPKKHENNNIYYLVFSITLLIYFLTYNFEIPIFILIVFYSYQVINSYGAHLNFINLISFHCVIIYLIGPYLGYKMYSHFISPNRMLLSFMPVSAEKYFSFIFPGVISYFCGLLTFKTISIEKRIKNSFDYIRVGLNGKKYYGYFLVLFGYLSFYLVKYAPLGLTYVFNIAFLFLFTGILFIYFSKNRNSKDYLIIGFVSIWILLTAVRSTMFTIVVYMSVAISGILFYTMNISLLKKLIFFLVSFILLVAIQYTKTEIRIFKDKSKQEVSLDDFSKTILKNTTSVDNFTSGAKLLNIYERINQGALTAHVLENIPKRRAHDNGKMLFKSILASFIPRIFWKSKPMAGGKGNMKYYANIKLGTASMNVGPIGEAYGAFGKFGSWIYMFFFGAFISYTFNFFLKKCLKHHLLLFWMPVIFYQTIYSAETDSMQVFNSIIKTGFLLYLLFKIFPYLFNLSKSKQI